MKHQAWGLEDGGDPFLTVETEDGGVAVTIHRDEDHDDRTEHLTIDDTIWMRDRLDLALRLHSLAAGHPAPGLAANQAAKFAVLVVLADAARPELLTLAGGVLPSVKPVPFRPGMVTAKFKIAREDRAREVAEALAAWPGAESVTLRRVLMTFDDLPLPRAARAGGGSTDGR